MTFSETEFFAKFVLDAKVAPFRDRLADFIVTLPDPPSDVIHGLISTRQFRNQEFTVDDEAGSLEDIFPVPLLILCPSHLPCRRGGPFFSSCAIFIRSSAYSLVKASFISHIRDPEVKHKAKFGHELLAAIAAGYAMRKFQKGQKDGNGKYLVTSSQRITNSKSTIRRPTRPWERNIRSCKSSFSRYCRYFRRYYR